MSPTEDNVYRFEGFTLDLSRGALLSAAHSEIPLRPKAFALLCLLVKNAGRLLDRDTIMTAIWPKVLVTEDSITQCVREIRTVLGDEAQRLLRAVRGRGYILSTTVLRMRAPPSFVDQDCKTMCDQGISPSWKRAPAVGIRGFLDLSLAVLPFQDLGGDSPGFSLSKSITEDLRIDLSRWSQR